MQIGSVNFVKTNEKIKNTDIVKIVANDSKTGAELGTITAEAATKSIYNQPLSIGYYDHLNSTKYRKIVLPHMHITDLGVDESVRNQGLGRKLVALIVKESKDRGYKGKVIVLAGNGKAFESSPLPFYKRIGFSVADKSLDNRLDFAAKYKTSFDKSIQAFMTLSRDAAEKLLKSLQRI